MSKVLDGFCFLTDSIGCVLDRDKNAAINILRRANTVGQTEIRVLGQTTHCLLGESLVDKVTG